MRALSISFKRLFDKLHKLAEKYINIDKAVINQIFLGNLLIFLRLESSFAL